MQFLHYRKQVRLTQKEVSDAAGITQGYYSELESGKKQNVSLPTLRKLAEVLQTSIENLLQEKAG